MKETATNVPAFGILTNNPHCKILILKSKMLEFDDRAQQIKMSLKMDWRCVAVAAALT